MPAKNARKSFAADKPLKRRSRKKQEVIRETKGNLVEVRRGIKRDGGLPDGRDG